jgi:hypothetical protein
MSFGKEEVSNRQKLSVKILNNKRTILQIFIIAIFMNKIEKPLAAKCEHKFNRKMTNGTMCGNCGTALTDKSVIR